MNTKTGAEDAELAEWFSRMANEACGGDVEKRFLQAAARLSALSGERGRALEDALKDIADGPQPLEDYEMGIRCGLEDRGLQNSSQYAAAEYGYAQGLDWCADIARRALKNPPRGEQNAGGQASDSNAALLDADRNKPVPPAPNAAPGATSAALGPEGFYCEAENVRLELRCDTPCKECAVVTQSALNRDSIDQAAAPVAELIERLPPVLQVLVDWERANGTLAGILPSEFADLMDKLTDAACIQSPREAASALQRHSACHDAAERDQGCFRAVKAERELAEAIQRLSECERDAARYRWLTGGDELRGDAWRAFKDARGKLLPRLPVMGKGAVDAAIDALKNPPRWEQK